MSDLISRQAAIDAMEQAKEQYFDRRVIIGKMQNVVSNLPSAQPVQWIPCSERLPEDGNYVLITTFGKVVASYFDEKVDVWRSEGAIYGTRTVQAWMPFPNPYKERNG